MVNICGNNQAAGGNLIADQSGIDPLTLSNEGHLLSDLAEAGEVHLRDIGVAGAGDLGLAIDDPLGPRTQNLGGPVAIRGGYCAQAISAAMQTHNHLKRRRRG